jgi:hypothetical protein
MGMYVSRRVNGAFERWKEGGAVRVDPSDRLIGFVDSRFYRDPSVRRVAVSTTFLQPS